jgi:thiol-disulfide isomerase/thioredoxin
MANRWIMLALVLLLGGFGLYLYLNLDENVPPPEKPTPKPAAEPIALADWKLKDLKDREIRFGDLRGKVVFINFWATYCAPCIHEMPAIQKLYESLQGSDIAFLVVSMEGLNRVRRLVREREWKVPIYVAEIIPDALDIDGYPTTFIADRKGEIVNRYVGSKDWNTDGFRNYLRSIP